MLKNYLMNLLEIDGVSGFEHDVAKYMSELFGQYGGDISMDSMGNVLATFEGKEEGKSVLVFAHMDEVGFMVRKIEDDGFIRFERIGGPAKNTLLGSKVTLKGDFGAIYGCVGVKSYHFSDAVERSSFPLQSDLWIDIGANSKSQVQDLGINVGTPITIKNDPVELANNLICSKALDDRVGCAILLELAEEFSKNQPNHTVHLVASVQEEFNIRGIMPVFSKINPDLAIGIDVTPSCDTPDLRGYSDIMVNKGVGLTCLNYHGRGTLAGLIAKPSIVKHLSRIANKNNVKFELEVAPGVLTETSYIQLENGGIPCGSLSIPCRYTHSTSEVASLNDMKGCFDILRELVNEDLII